jgi:hypothetical protein
VEKQDRTELERKFLDKKYEFKITVNGIMQEMIAMILRSGISGWKEDIGKSLN